MNGQIRLPANQNEVLTVMIDGKELASINRDGSVKYHSDYSPDIVAATFWAALAMMCPARTIPAGWTIEPMQTNRGPGLYVCGPDGAGTQVTAMDPLDGRVLFQLANALIGTAR